jgi:hypothetical protein
MTGRRCRRDLTHGFALLLLPSPSSHSIETSEFGVLDDVIAAYQGRPLPFGQLLIEIHAWKWQKPKVSTMVPWLENLEKAGLRPFMSEPNLGKQTYRLWSRIKTRRPLTAAR